ncbi:tRNA wybutosine-synthesizing protein 5 isoform X2 [Cricetulus griseus]|uniref:tRNA wybutosine-synthesizing protein 5 isoform X2 n=1 Tax=Cricetulus griseus TaxID=10029 RepID=A0A9J7JCC9_CRIGR|nr:tRNA wybutosine-synthesizing protein 5 isoform X2 [Cricetulus griseus]XP_027252718.1 tRNA wybutosine-synthesizing protein 5 isoform X2 [Cricetulus griseus]ERE86320.1 tRNA wybutosine-synthesizing protein 5-like isoform 1 [Cricetulus griseus]
MAEQCLPVPRLRGVTREHFMEHLYPQRMPLVLEGLDLGSCTSKWTVGYLSQAGGTKEVKVHVAAVPQMNFISKNFVYRTLPFNKLVQRAAEETHKEFFISEDEKYYLRSLGEDPRKDVADIRQQFPSLGGDIKFPIFFEEGQFFSSVFRISSPGLQLWTHYDVLNLKCWILTALTWINTHSSLRRGALWFHNVISEEFGVGVNVFWKHLPSECYDKTDTYGNKDPVAASRAVQILDRALKTLAELPEEYRDFYARQMVLRIQDKAYSKNFK